MMGARRFSERSPVAIPTSGEALRRGDRALHVHSGAEHLASAGQHRATDRVVFGDPAPGRRQLGQHCRVERVGAFRPIEKRKVLDVPESQRLHLEDDAGDVRTENLRLSEVVAPRVVLLAVETNANTLSDPAA